MITFQFALPSGQVSNPSIRGTIRGGVGRSIPSAEDDDDRSTSGNCPSVPRGFCAVLYDDENCRGWSKNISRGKHVLREGYRNDAEVVVVRRGCKITGMKIIVKFQIRQRAIVIGL